MSSTLIRKNDAPSFSQHGTHVIGYASPSRGAASVSMWQLALAAGSESPLHQLTQGEAFLALSGEAIVELAERQQVFQAGDGLWVPPGVPFRIRNAGTQPFVAVACMVAGGKAQVGDLAPFTPPWAL